MFSSSLLRCMSALLMLAMGALSSCAVNEGPPKEKVKDISKQSLMCLSTLKADLEDYFNGRSSEEKINDLYTCSLAALKTFQTQTRGASDGKFTAEEVRNFLSRYFLDDLKISDNLLHEIMIVKKALLGGKDSDFTYSDLDSTGNTLNIIRQMMVRLNPYMPFSFNRLQGESDAYVNNAGVAIQDVAELFADLITQKNTVYALSDMNRLLKEITAQFPGAATLVFLQEKIDLVASLKQFLISPSRSRDEVSAEEWRVMLTEGSQWFSIFMRFRQMEYQHPDYLVNIETETRFSSLIHEGLLLTRKVVARHEQGTSFDSIRQLLEDLLGQYPDAQTIKKIHDNLDLIASLKKLVVSPNSPRDRLTLRDWTVVEQDGVSWLKLWMKYDALSQESDWTSGIGRKQLESMGHDLFPMFNAIVKRHGGLIAFETIRQNIALIGPDVLPKGLTIKAIQDLMPTVIRRLVGGIDPGINGRKALGLNATGIKNLKSLFDDWMLYNRYAEGVYLKLSRGAPVMGEMAFDLDSLKSVSTEEALIATGEATPDQIQRASEFSPEITELPAFFAKNSTGLVFDGENWKRPRLYSDIYQRTWMRALFKRVTLGYMEGDDISQRMEDPKKFGLKIEEFKRLIADYWQILVDFKLVGKENSPEIDGNKRFLESSLFMFASDGNKLISMDEGAQLVTFMISASPMGKAGHRYAITHCPTGEEDEFGVLEIEPECYRNTIYDVRSSNPAANELWKNFPVFREYADTLSDSALRLLMKRVEDAARKKGYQKDVYVNSSDSDSVFMLVHYIEAVFLRYDLNQSGGLSNKESRKAFQVFKGKLSDVSGYDQDSFTLKAVFAWLLDKGSSPVDESKGGWGKLGDSVSFGAWYLKGWVTGTWKIHSQRSNLYSVLSEINKMKSAPKKSPEIPTPTVPPAPETDEFR